MHARSQVPRPRKAAQALHYAARGVAACALAMALTALAPATVRAQGGPPLITDDPDTPGPGYWEINVAAQMESSHERRSMDSPRLDLNYGAGQRVQLKFEVPFVVLRTSQDPPKTGLGDAVIGVKWRFLGQEGHRIAWSVYPQIELNTTHSSVSKGLVESGSEALLPTEITVEVAHLEINGEIGRDFVEHGRSTWVEGLSTEAHVRPPLELLAELHREHSTGEPAVLVANVGAREKLTGRMTLMLAVGQTVRAPIEQHHVLLYAGLQLNLPGRYVFR
jgi:hypothetical protein